MRVDATSNKDDDGCVFVLLFLIVFCVVCCFAFCWRFERNRPFITSILTVCIDDNNNKYGTNQCDVATH